MWTKIAKEHLRLADGERFVVIGDSAPELPYPAEIVVAPATGGHGREPSPEVWNEVFGAAAVGALEFAGVFERLLEKRLEEADAAFLDTWVVKAREMAPRAVLAVTHFSTSHTMFRKLLTRCGCRYASMPLFQPELLRAGGALDVDLPAMVARTRSTARRLSRAGVIRVTTPIGTDITFSVHGRAFLADDGDLSEPGAFGNLPAGEVYVAPLEGTGEGRVAVKEDVILEVRGGRVERISGRGEHPVRRKFEANPGHFLLAELGIGTNDRASLLDNVLEAEKIQGTVHVAFGDNASFGGTQSIPYHEDHVLFEPTVYVDGQFFPLPGSAASGAGPSGASR